MAGMGESNYVSIQIGGFIKDSDSFNRLIRVKKSMLFYSKKPQENLS